MDAYTLISLLISALALITSIVSIYTSIVSNYKTSIYERAIKMSQIFKYAIGYYVRDYTFQGMEIPFKVLDREVNTSKVIRKLDYPRHTFLLATIECTVLGNQFLNNIREELLTIMKDDYLLDDQIHENTIDKAVWGKLKQDRKTKLIELNDMIDVEFTKSMKVFYELQKVLVSLYKQARSL